jgi:carboxyl-terminal processing protease
MIIRKGWMILGAVVLIIITSLGTFFGTKALFFDSSSNFSAESLFEGDNITKEEIMKFNQVKGYLKNYYYKEVDDSVLLEGAIAGMANALGDRYTYYLNQEEMMSLVESSHGSYVGIGVLVTQDEDNILRVLEPFEGSPAIKAGIMPGDRITAVDDIDVTGNKDENITISMIKGEENTEVKITVYRESENKLLDFIISRKTIKIVNIEAKQITEHIGYIKLKMFDENISISFRREVEKLQNLGMRGLIIDVRDNPGGDYAEVVNMVDMLVPSGLILYTENRNGERNEEISDANELNIPMVVLVNGNSASASEILAGALKDYDKAEIIGIATFGKGLVQSVIPLENDDTGLKVTIASYYTPKGNIVHGVGIEPDIIVELDEKYEYYPASMVPEEDDLQLAKGIEVILEALKKNGE